MVQTIKPGRYAAIDIGTVTSRILVADVDVDGALRTLARRTVITNLGQGVDESRRLLPEAIERVAAAIADFMDVAKGLGPGADGEPVRVSAVTTSAARDAQNGGDLVARLAQLGVDLQIIPGEREAALSFAGVSSAFPGQRIAVVDAGGGSTEIIVGAAGGAPEFVHSFNVGCRRATERFLKSDPPTSDEIAAMRAWVGDELRKDLPDASILEGCRMVAVAGTATSSVSIREAMEVYDSERVHLAEMTTADLESICNRLAAMTVAERQQVVGLEPKRAPVIVAGLVILQEVMRLGGFASFTVSESDILAGIIYAAACE